jgi:hypothetical protein
VAPAPAVVDLTVELEAEAVVVEVVAAAVAVAAVGRAKGSAHAAYTKAMERTMRADRWHGTATGNRRRTLLVLLASAFIASGAGAATTQRNFASPEAAVNALVQAVKAQDRAATLTVLGADAAAWISSGDVATDRATVGHFVAVYDEKHEIVRDGNRATLTLGSDDFPFAFPIVRRGERWRFDTAAGKEEMLVRRIGENELSAIKVLQAIVDAQMEYASEDRNGDGVLEYSLHFASSPGKHDGLYWPVKPGEPESPLGKLVAQAAGEGFQGNDQSNKSGPIPYHGYYYRMLKSQGKSAALGAFDYVIHGRAIAGFAVCAYPARYGNSGIMTFMVNQDGKIYQADLGPETQKHAQQLQQFSPGQRWSVVQGQ